MQSIIWATIVFISAHLAVAGQPDDPSTGSGRASVEESASETSDTCHKTETRYTEVLKELNSAIRREVEQKELPSFSISLVDKNRVVWAKGFGFQDADKKIPATAQTVYRVGSVSKLFTDIAVMQLVESGKLDLNDPIQKHLPDLKPLDPYGVPITLRQLMSHRSGLVRESPVGNYFDPSEPTLTETVASLNKTSLVYMPGKKTKYSNAAIAVVGAVLEKHLDVSHAHQVRQRILDPLEMKDSSFVVTPAVERKLATWNIWIMRSRLARHIAKVRKFEGI